MAGDKNSKFFEPGCHKNNQALVMWCLASNINNTPPVTPDEFARRITKALASLSDAAGGIILPLAGFGLLVSIGLFIAGSIFRSETLRKSGAGGIGACLAGIVLYFAIPVIIGLLQTVSLILKG